MFSAARAHCLGDLCEKEPIFGVLGWIWGRLSVTSACSRRQRRSGCWGRGLGGDTGCVGGETGSRSRSRRGFYSFPTTKLPPPRQEEQFNIRPSTVFFQLGLFTHILWFVSVSDLLINPLIVPDSTCLNGRIYLTHSPWSGHGHK